MLSSEGVCVRLYSEEDLAERSEFTDPEIRRAALAGVILRMLSLGLGRIGKTHVLPDTRDVRGMINRVPHLIEVEEVVEGQNG